MTANDLERARRTIHANVLIFKRQAMPENKSETVAAGEQQAWEWFEQQIPGGQFSERISRAQLVEYLRSFAQHETKGLLEQLSEARKALEQMKAMRPAGVGNYVHSREGCPFMYCDQEAPFTACKEKCRHV